MMPIDAKPMTQGLRQSCPFGRPFARPFVLPTLPCFTSSPAVSPSPWDGTDPLLGGHPAVPGGSRPGGIQ